MAKIRGSLSPTMHEMADQMHPVAPPATTVNNASPSINDARTIQRKVMRGGAEAPPAVNARAPQTIGNPFTAMQKIDAALKSSNSRRR